MDISARVRDALSAYNSEKNKLVRIIGILSDKGAFSTVFEVVDEKKTIYAMKAVDTIIHGSTNKEMIYNYTIEEIENMKLLGSKSKHIMSLYDSFYWCSKPESYKENCIGRRDQGNLLCDGVFLIFMPKLKPCMEVFKKNGFDEDSIVAMGLDICKALSLCHQNHILHRDVKPENIYYSPEQNCFVLSDLGVSRKFILNDSGPGTVTVIGTPSTIAPEIRDGKNLNGRYNADIFSLGMTMRLLLEKNLSSKPQPFTGKLRKVIDKATRIDPRRRYQTAGSFYRDLSAGLSNKCLVKTDHRFDISKNAYRLIAFASLIVLFWAALSYKEYAIEWLQTTMIPKVSYSLSLDRLSALFEDKGRSLKQAFKKHGEDITGQDEENDPTNEDIGYSKKYQTSISESGKALITVPDPVNFNGKTEPEESSCRDISCKSLSFVSYGDYCCSEGHGKVKDQNELNGFIYWNGDKTFSRSYFDSSSGTQNTLADYENEPLHHVYLDFSGKNYYGMAINISLFGEKSGLNMTFHLESEVLEFYISEGHYSVTAEIWEESGECTFVYETIDLFIDRCGRYCIYEGQ